MSLQPNRSQATPGDHKPHSLGSMLHKFDHRWGWVLAIGIVSVALGFMALGLLVSATIVSVLTIGFFMIVTGGFEMAVGFAARSWGKSALWIVAGLLYAVAGAVTMAQPGLAATIFTLILGAGFLATGVIRLWLAYEMPAGSRALALISALITALLGVMIVSGWPGNSLIILGTLLGIDLIFYGARWIGLGLTLRRLSNAR